MHKAFEWNISITEVDYPKTDAMRKMSPGARLGIAVAIAGEVSLIPWSNKVWNNVTLKTNAKRVDIVALIL